MTEDEAKTKTCPAMLMGAQNKSPLCVGSACMAWRWDTHPIEGRPGSEEAVQIGNRMHVERIPKIVAVTGLGHCGLAGSGS